MMLESTPVNDSKGEEYGTCVYCLSECVNTMSTSFNTYTRNYEIKKFCERCKQYYVLELLKLQV